MIPGPPIFRWFLYAAAVCACLGWFAHQSDSIGALLFIGASFLAFGPITITAQRGVVTAARDFIERDKNLQEFDKNWRGGR